MGFPWRDPQFWIVTGAALVAFAYVLRKRLRIRPRSGPGAANGGAVELPCDHCARAGEHLAGAAGGAIGRSGPAGKKEND